MSGKFLFTTAVLLQLFVVSPANAQMPADDITSPNQTSQPSQSSQMNMRPGVRYTTGSYRISGWEDKLVTGNPNLGRWNWSAMVGYTQSTGSNRTRAQAIKAPLPDRRLAGSPTASHYVKPIHVPLPTVQHTQDVSRTTDTNLAYQNTKLAYHANSPAPVMSYGGSYAGTDRVIAHSSVSGSLVHRGVNASLIRSN